MKVQTLFDSAHENPIVEVKVVSDAGVVLDEFKCTYDQYLSSLMDSTMRKLQKLNFDRTRSLRPKQLYDRTETPALPRGCVKHVWLSRSQDIQLVFVEIPKRKWDISYFNKDLVYEQVGFPRMLFGYKLNGNRVVDLYCLALKGDQRVTDDMQIYKFPFANVSNGLVCMGGNKFPLVKDLTRLTTLHNLFFQAPSTGCSYNARNLSGFRKLDELYHELSNKDFPDEWLVPKDVNFGTFVQGIRTPRQLFRRS